MTRRDALVEVTLFQSNTMAWLTADTELDCLDRLDRLDEGTHRFCKSCQRAVDRALAS